MTYPGVVAAADPLAYVRPADWVALPTVTAGQQKFVGLVAVWNNDSNFVGLKFQGAYTVDWGDGSATENFTSNAVASHTYSYAAVSNLSSRGYRQAVLTVTPQSGQNLTTMSLNEVATNGRAGQGGLWLDIKMAGTTFSAFTLTGSNAPARMLEQFEFVGACNVTDFTNKFIRCSSLQNLVSLDTHLGTNFYGMFSDCASLQSVPLLVTSAGTDFSGMFTGCRALQTVPLINTSSGTLFSGMFYDCASLQSVPLLVTSAGTDFSNTFGECPSLRAIPALNVTAATSFSGMFAGCVSLSRILMVNAKKSLNLSSCNLSAAALNEVYTNLGTSTPTSQVITVTGNWGTAADTPSIATAKSWTVTG